MPAAHSWEIENDFAYKFDLGLQFKRKGKIGSRVCVFKALTNILANIKLKKNVFNMSIGSMSV